MTETNEPVRLTANGITIELNLTQVLTALDPQGHYRGYDPESDEDHFESASLEHHIVDATAALLVKSLRKEVKDAVMKATTEQIQTEVETVVRETLDGPVQQTTSWGTPSGESQPLRDLIGAMAKDALKKPELRDGYSRSGGETMVQKIIAKEVASSFTKEMKAVVDEAKAEALAAVKASAAQVITETIDRARRNLV